MSVVVQRSVQKVHQYVHDDSQQPLSKEQRPMQNMQQQFKEVSQQPLQLQQPTMGLEPSMQDIIMHPPMQDLASPPVSMRTPPNKSPSRESISAIRRAKTRALSAKKELNLYTINNSKSMSFKMSSHKTVIDSGASTSGTGQRGNLRDLRPTSCRVSAAFGETA